MSQRETCDVFVLGAGSSGSATALALAREGLKVIVGERRELAQAGARWVNGLPSWFFDFCELDLPTGDELQNRGNDTKVVTSTGEVAYTLSDTPLWNVDMRRLTERLQDLCRAQGVRFLDHFELGGVHVDAQGRPTSIEFQRGQGTEVGSSGRIEAELFVDASGIKQALLRRVEALSADCPPLVADQYCLALSEAARIEDREAALAYLERHGARPGESTNAFGVDRGYSTLLVSFDEAVEHIDIVIGTAGGDKSPRQILREFKEREPWVGERVFGGEAMIPLRQPYDRLAAPGIALVGDAGCMVFSTHGSGVGMGMAAGKMLADAVANSDDPGGLDATWAYQATFQRRFGGRLGGMAVLARFFQSLDGDDVDKLLLAGFLPESNMRLGLEQRSPVPTAREILGLLGAVARAPSLGAKLLPFAARIPAVLALYSLYPKKPGRRALRAWSRAVARSAGLRPDLR